MLFVSEPNRIDVDIAPYVPFAPKGPLKERARIVRELQHRFINDADVLELRRRLKARPRFETVDAYFLPYHVILTRSGFQLGRPSGHWQNKYCEYLPLAPTYLRNVSTAVEAETEIKQKLRDYVEEQRPCYGSGGTRHISLKACVAAASAPLLGLMYGRR